MVIMSERKIKVALAGNANVGKSAIFNCLTGLHQHIGNWPGKTVERAIGSLKFKEYEIEVIDLPGIYSFSTFSLEELISREYIAVERPDVVINVIDASVLERNLFFALQLLELQAPIIIALNQVDLARRKGINICEKKLSDLLGVPVISTIAIKGVGIHELIESVIEVVEGKKKIELKRIEYGREVEDRLRRLEDLLSGLKTTYPARFTALKLLEGDEEIKREISFINEKIVSASERYAREIEEIHGEPCFSVISSERYVVASKIAKEVQEIAPAKMSLIDRVDEIIMHKFLGYLIMLIVMFSVFYAIFAFGNFLSAMISDVFETLKPAVLKVEEEILWEGAIGGFVACITLVLPYVLPFYLLLTVLEDSGYLPRIAFLLDNVMHKMGLHGKAIIPLILGYGCNVPACYSCRIMETQRDRLIAAFAVTFIPCTARIIVILGLVASFISMEWAFTLLLIDLAITFAVSRAAFKALPGEPIGLIMEVHSLRVPSINVVVSQTWARLKSIILLVFPIYVIGGTLLAIMYAIGLLRLIEEALAPLTMGWLGLPPIAGALLLFGAVRKELVVAMPAIIFGTIDLSTVFTPIQMLVLAFLTMIYVPCVATYAMLKREFGWKVASYITIFEVAFGLLLSGIFYRLLLFIGL